MSDASNEVLLLDLGNTRLKWRQGQQATAAAAQLDEFFTAAQAIAKPSDILICAVGDEQCYQDLAQFCVAHWGMAPRRLQVSRFALGVQNHYADISQQGSDRWAAVLGAWSRFPAQNLLIISAGTALVIDCLSRNGQFLGGTISPGLGLMKQALFTATAKLPLAQGQDCAFPNNTHDAIETGCRRAMKGIVLESIENMNQNGIPPEQIIIFGGDATLLHGQFPCPTVCTDNLVLDGLYALHQAADGAFTQ
jgi:type III pantothenate kinase